MQTNKITDKLHVYTMNMNQDLYFCLKKQRLFDKQISAFLLSLMFFVIRSTIRQQRGKCSLIRGFHLFSREWLILWIPNIDVRVYFQGSVRFIPWVVLTVEGVSHPSCLELNFQGSVSFLGFNRYHVNGSMYLFIIHFNIFIISKFPYWFY